MYKPEEKNNNMESSVKSVYYVCSATLTVLLQHAETTVDDSV